MEALRPRDLYVNSLVRYQPVPVKELLKEMKNVSELMVDLAYYSLLYGDEKLAKEVQSLEKRMDYLSLVLPLQTAYATRGLREAEKLVSVYILARSLEKISNAAGDLANISLLRFKIPVLEPSRVFLTEDTIYRIGIQRDSWAENRTIEEVFQKLDSIFDVLAVRRVDKWFYQPSKGFELNEGDSIIARGLFETLKNFKSLAGEEMDVSVDWKKEVKRDVWERIFHLKDTSDLAVDLAYTSMITRSEHLAKQVKELEEHFDNYYKRLEYEIVHDERLSAEEKMVFLEVVLAAEIITDAAEEMVQPILKGLEPHPIIEEVLDETQERISAVKVEMEESEKTLDDLDYEKKGVKVLAIKREDTWYVEPPHTSLSLKEGDILIVKYLSESQEFVESLESEKDREEIIDEIQEEWEEE